jgi:ABC-type uncharacterized transport system auxiliary subunit
LPDRLKFLPNQCHENKELTMKTKKTTLLAVAMAAALLAGCASTRTLQVNYHLPAAAAAASQPQMALSIVDKRVDMQILGPGAREILKDFAGRLILVVVTPDQTEQLTAAYDLNTTFYEAFKRRLEQAGVVVLPKGTAADRLLEVHLKEFYLEAIGSKWTLKAAYNAVMLHNDQETANQTASGSAERFKTMGRGEAEKLLSDVVTDMVNKLDIAKLLDGPGGS